LRYASCALVGMLHLEALGGLMLGKAWGKMEFWEEETISESPNQTLDLGHTSEVNALL
jgi:hypothetical protein